MPRPNVNTRLTDGGGSGRTQVSSPYAPSSYYQEQQRRANLIAEANRRQQQAEAARRAQLIAEANQRAQQQIMTEQTARAQIESWANLPSGLETFRQQTASMQPVQPVRPTRLAPNIFSFSYNLPNISAVSPPAYQEYVNNGMTTNKPFYQQAPIRRTGQTVSPTTVPTSKYTGWTWEPFSRRDAYGNLVPYGPLNEYWEFSDIPVEGYGGGYGGYGGYGGGYTPESSAPFYRGGYTQGGGRWNETLLTWSLRQE